MANRTTDQNLQIIGDWAATGVGSTAPTAAAIATAQLGGLSASQEDAVTGGSGAWLAAVTIPANTKFVDFLLDIAAYVVCDATAGNPTNNGVPYQPNLNFRIPCFGATKLHIKATTEAVATMKWNAIA